MHQGKSQGLFHTANGILRNRFDEGEPLIHVSVELSASQSFQ